MSDADDDTLPVYLCAPGEHEKDPAALIGRAASKAKAARLIREHNGDPGYRASDVYFSGAFMAYFADE